MHMNRKLMGLVAITCAFVLGCAVTALAYTQEEIDAMTGPAFGISSTYTADGAKGTPTVQYGDLVNAKDNEDGTFTFEGKTYVVDYGWGQHCLTGYADTGSCTASGKYPKVLHTISGPKAMLGKVALVKGAYVRGKSGGRAKTYDGIYVFEDTGGAAVEYGTANTMNTPVVDIYRGSNYEADLVSEAGSIVADVYILREIE